MDLDDDDDGVEEALSLIATTELMYERPRGMSRASSCPDRWGAAENSTGSRPSRRA